MEVVQDYAFHFLQISGLFAPIVFILFHLIRPLVFVPVVLLCISGGLLFGTFYGMIYSLIGITLSTILFYKIANWLPNSFQRLLKMKRRIFGENHQFTTKQIAILRLIPFIHFHLLSLCLYEAASDFRSYTKSATLSNIPLAFLYTALGETIIHLSIVEITVVLLVITLLFMLFRKKLETIEWQTFFKKKLASSDSGVDQVSN